jgi:hypothetical protein
MKIRINFLFLLFFLFAGNVLIAQNSILDELALHEPGKGTVTIHQSAAIRSLVGNRARDVSIETIGNKSYIVMPGYQIQVFAGNDQRTSMAEAQNKESQIKNRFSDIPTYLTFTAPFWRLRAGDCLSYEEAFFFFVRLAEAFPSFRREIQIVKEEVKIPLN